MNHMSEYKKNRIKTDVAVSKLVSIHYFEYTKDYKYHGEQHDFWDVMYVDLGRAFVTCGETEHLLSRGDIIFLPPDLFHNIRADELRPSNVFIISFDVKSEAIPLLAGRVFTLSSEMRRLIRTIVQEGRLAFELPMRNHYCLQERDDAHFGCQQIVQIRLEELIIQIVRQELVSSLDGQTAPLPLKSRFDHQIAEAVMELLKDRVHGNLTIQEITQRLGYGKTYLIRENTLSIAEISELLGFQFAAAFF